MAIKTCIGSYCSEKKRIAIRQKEYAVQKFKVCLAANFTRRIHVLIRNQIRQLVEDSFVNSKPSLDCKSKDMIGTAFHSIEQL